MEKEYWYRTARPRRFLNHDGRLTSIGPADGDVRAGAYGPEVDVAVCVFVEVHLTFTAVAASADGGEEGGDEKGGDRGHGWWCVVSLELY